MSEVEATPVPDRMPDDALPAPRSMLERLIEQDHVKAIEKIEAMTKVLDHLRLASIRSTYPTDWVIHSATDKDGNLTRQVGYLMDCGAERAGKVWGIEIGQPIVEREDFPSDDPPSFVYNMMAEAHSKVTGQQETYEGSRWSGDKFFTSRLRDGERQDPVEVRKAAYANLHGRAVRALGGLNAVPLEMLKSAGIDVTKVMHITYGAGSSQAGVGSAELVIAWGNCQGKKVSELTEKDLTWYLDREKKNLADPAKAKWVKKTQRTVDQLEAELTKRKTAAEHEAETGAEKPQGKAPDAPADGTRGARLSTLHAALKEAFGAGNLKHVLPFLSMLMARKVEAVSDLKDDEIPKVMELGAEKLRAEAQDFIAAAG